MLTVLYLFIMPVNKKIKKGYKEYTGHADVPGIKKYKKSRGCNCKKVDDCIACKLTYYTLYPGRVIQSRRELADFPCIKKRFRQTKQVIVEKPYEPDIKIA